MVKLVIDGADVKVLSGMVKLVALVPKDKLLAVAVVIVPLVLVIGVAPV